METAFSPHLCCMLMTCACLANRVVFSCHLKSWEVKCGRSHSAEQHIHTCGWETACPLIPKKGRKQRGRGERKKDSSFRAKCDTSGLEMLRAERNQLTLNQPLSRHSSDEGKCFDRPPEGSSLLSD